MTDENQAQNSNERAYRWIEKHPLAALSIAAVVIFIMVVIYWAIWADSSPTWTGFGTYDEDAAGPRAKTLWDWLGLLIVPVAVAIGAAVISYFQKRTELDIAKKARETEQKIATDRQMQATLEAYYDRMTELLLEHDLKVSEPDSEVRSIARARTVAVVKSLDGERNRQLFAFLKASNLIDSNLPIIDFSHGDLSGVNLERNTLRRINLRQVDLSKANLSGTNLVEANLTFSDLIDCSLAGANLSFVNLSYARLIRANLNEARMIRTNLLGASLHKADLRDSMLIGAEMSQTSLQGADMKGAYLYRAALRDAKNWTLLQFDQVKNLEGATMPDGITLCGPSGVGGPTYEEWKAQYLAKQGSG